MTRRCPGSIDPAMLNFVSRRKPLCVVIGYSPRLVRPERGSDQSEHELPGPPLWGFDGEVAIRRLALLCVGCVSPQWRGQPSNTVRGLDPLPIPTLFDAA
jgi:hypothetical protein